MTTEPNFNEILAYIPKKGEEFMSKGQQKHFIHKLNVWREQLVFEAENTINHIQEDSAPVADNLYFTGVLKFILKYRCYALTAYIFSRCSFMFLSLIYSSNVK